MKIELLEIYITGHADIDDDHRNLIEIINLVSDALSSNELDKCKQLLDSFVEVARDHFAREEAILREVKFPGVNNHCEYHESLLKQAIVAKNLCQEMAVQGSIKECFDELALFLIDDVIKGDHTFVSHLVEVGVAAKK